MVILFGHNVDFTETIRWSPESGAEKLLKCFVPFYMHWLIRCVICSNWEGKSRHRIGVAGDESEPKGVWVVLYHYGGLDRFINLNQLIELRIVAQLRPQVAQGMPLCSTQVRCVGVQCTRFKFQHLAIPVLDHVYVLAHYSDALQYELRERIFTFLCALQNSNKTDWLEREQTAVQCTQAYTWTGMTWAKMQTAERKRNTK